MKHIFMEMLVIQIKSSRPVVFCEKKVLRNFEKIHRKTPVNFAKLLKSPFLKEHLCWLLILTDIDVCILDFEFPLASEIFPYDCPYLECGSNSYNPYEYVRGSKSSPTFLVESDRGLWCNWIKHQNKVKYLTLSGPFISLTN